MLSSATTFIKGEMRTTFINGRFRKLRIGKCKILYKKIFYVGAFCTTTKVGTHSPLKSHLIEQ